MVRRAGLKEGCYKRFVYMPFDLQLQRQEAILFTLEVGRKGAGVHESYMFIVSRIIRCL